MYGGGAGFQIHMGGRPKLNGWSNVQIDLVVSKPTGNGFALAAGFDFIHTNFASLVKKLTGRDISSLHLLDSSLQCAIVVSSRDMPGVTLKGPMLSQLSSVSKGLTFKAIFRFPANCTDKFCKFAISKIGRGASLQLGVTIVSVDEFEISASANNINLGAIVLQQVALVFAIGDNPYVEFSVNLKLPHPALTFKGAIRLKPEGLQLEMDMLGMWKRPFQINWLAFGNAMASITIEEDVIPGFEVGGTIWLGKLDTPKTIKATVAVGFDPEDPQNDYFYGHVNDLTVGSILDAFQISASLPKCLKETGFPKGLTISFSELGKTTHTGVVIPQGFTFNGTVDILGYHVVASIAINANGVKIDSNWIN
eukprot:m.216544 g.216544  ORF g.216544 m.216544 type:complete len:365 (+) comp39871_c0_seq3:96-1190(+)